MTLPVAPLVRPSDLQGQANGELDAHLLVPVEGDQMHHLAARSWRAMQAAATRDRVRIAVGADAYRPLATQEAIFVRRYRTVPVWVPTARKWNGQWWVKKRGEDAAAVPGTSNHGWGLAVDVDECSSENTPACRWLKAFAKGYGWSAEIQSEAWHWRAVHGDRLPPAVVAYEASLTPTPPPSVVVPPSEEDDDMIMARNSDTGEVVLLIGGAVRPCTGAVYDDLIAAGVKQVDVPTQDFNLFIGR